MRIEQLTFSRFLAAISIVVFHFGMQTPPFNSEVISFLFSQANVGVSYFFILSGFVMIIAYSNRDKVSFIPYMKNRIARIYPVYFIAVILTLAKYVIADDSYSAFAIIGNITMLQSWFPDIALSLNFPGWSISVEMFFYMVFPFLLNRVFKKISFSKLLIYTVAFFTVSQFVFHIGINSSFYQPEPSSNHNLFFYFPLLHLSEFIIGNLAGLFFINKLKDIRKNFDLPILLLILATAFFLKYPMGMNYHNGLFAVLFVPMILFLAMNTGYITKISNRKPFVFLGEISYGVYILQWPVRLWLEGGLRKFGLTDPAVMFYPIVIGIIIAATISYKYIETPLRKKIKLLRLTKNR